MRFRSRIQFIRADFNLAATWTDKRCPADKYVGLRWSPAIQAETSALCAKVGLANFPMLPTRMP